MFAEDVARAPPIPDRPPQIDVPSTPMPGPSSATSPAWDPSSRTPLPHGTAFDIPGKYFDHSTVEVSDASVVVPVDWVLAPQLQKKTFLVRIQGTLYERWEKGKYENDMAAFLGPGITESSVTVKLQASFPKKMDVPARFLYPITPYKKRVGETAIVVLGDDVGAEVEVKNVEGDSWVVLNLATNALSQYPPLSLAALPIIRK
jgi:hypothetical protein